MLATLLNPSREIDKLNRHYIGAQVVLRSWPFRRGIGRIINNFFDNIPFDEDVVNVPTTDLINLSIFPNDLIGRHIYLTGEYERSTIEILCDFAEPGDTLLDIGANIGYISACFLKNVPDSKVIAIDPQPGVLDLLRSNLAQFSSSRYEILPIAISDHDGTAHFIINSKNRGNSRIDSAATPNTITVEVKSANSLFESETFASVNLVKIDVEGHEEQILSSCKTALQRIKPRAILFEEHGTKCMPGGPLSKLFDDIGYSIFGVKKRLFSTGLVPIRNAKDCNCNDYLAIAKGKPIPENARITYKLSPSTQWIKSDI